MKQLTTAMVLMIGLAFAYGASAEGRDERPPPPSFADIDGNSDQLVSQEEMESFMQEIGRKGGPRRGPGRDPERRFDRADADGDGYLSESEFDVAQEKMAEHRGRRHHRDDCEGRNDVPQDDSAE